MDAYWDEEEHCIQNHDDEHMSSLLENLDNNDVLPPVPKCPNLERSQQVPTQPEPLHQAYHSLQHQNTSGKDVDSVTTFSMIII